MGSEVAFHLSGGIFFNLMLAARKKPVANQNQCLKELLYIYDRSAKEMAGNSLVTIASRFRNCDPDLHSDYIRFGDPVVVEEFNGRMREDYASVVGEVKNYADQYLDLEVNGKWLVRALMELVEKDNLIQDNAKFMAIPGGLPAYKQEFPEMHVVYIYNLLLSVWHYICCTHGMAENGQETYFVLADFAGESRPRKFDCSRIGFESHEDVTVSYDMEIVQDDMKIPEPAAAYVRKLAGKPDKQLEIFAPVNSAVSKEVESIFSFVVEHTLTSDRKAALNRYRTYLNRAREKHSKKKTFLYEMQRDFYGFFVCNDVKRRETVYGGERRNDRKDDRVIENACIDSFEEERRFIVLSGTGGMGKSMMMTHFMLDTIEAARRKANHISKQDKISWYNASVMLSYMGLFKHTDTYNYYIDYIKPKINVKKLKRIVSKHSRKENEHGRLEKGDRNTAGQAGGGRQDIVAVNGLPA